MRAAWEGAQTPPGKNFTQKGRIYENGSYFNSIRLIIIMTMVVVMVMVIGSW
jgi:hypothetical protein